MDKLLLWILLFLEVRLTISFLASKAVSSEDLRLSARHTPKVETTGDLEALQQECRTYSSSKKNTEGEQISMMEDIQAVSEKPKSNDLFRDFSLARKHSKIMHGSLMPEISPKSLGSKSDNQYSKMSTSHRTGTEHQTSKLNESKNGKVLWERNSDIFAERTLNHASKSNNFSTVVSQNTKINDITKESHGENFKLNITKNATNQNISCNFHQAKTALLSTKTSGTIMKSFPMENSKTFRHKRQSFETRLSQVLKPSIEFDDDKDEESLKNLLLTLFLLDFQDCVLVISYEERFKESGILRVLLQLPNPRQLVEVSRPDDYGSFLWKSPMCRAYIILVETIEFLMTFASYDDYAWDFGGRYVLVGLTKSELRELTKSTKIAKSENFIGIVKYNRPNEWGLYTNDIVRPTRGIVHYALWRDSDFTTEKSTLFPDKLTNFQGATLTVTAFNWRPSVMYEWDDKGKVIKRYGRDIMVVRGLADALNATLVFNDASQKVLWGFRSPNGTWNGLMGIIQRGEAEIGVANLFITNVTKRMLVADFSVPFDIEVSCFLSRLPKPLPKWERILYPFEFITWLSILCGLILGGPVLYVLARIGHASGGERHDFKSFSFNVLHSVGIQFMEGQAITPMRVGTQVFICFLWLYAIIITTGYCSNLTALLTVARQPPTIDTIKELYESKLGVGGMGAIFGTALASSTNPYLQALAKRYDVYNGRINSMFSQTREGNIVIIAGWNVLRYMESIEFTHKGVTEARIIKETFSPFGIGLITQRGSPLKRKFDVFINRMVESGLVRYWFLESLRMAKQEIDKKKKREREINEETKDAPKGNGEVSNQGEDVVEVIEIEGDGFQSLSFEHLQGFFFILFVGYLAAGIVFLFEKRNISTSQKI